MEKSKNRWYSPVALDVRLTLYGVLLVTGIYYVFFDQTNYVCNLPGQSCPFCGMKTALYHLLHLRFRMAHESHPFVWVFAVVSLAIAVDLILILRRYITKKAT